MPNKFCPMCGGVLHFVHGQARCIDDKCELYWKGQGGMETLDPNPAAAQPKTNLPLTIKPPQQT